MIPLIGTAEVSGFFCNVLLNVTTTHMVYCSGSKGIRLQVALRVSSNFGTLYLALGVTQGPVRGASRLLSFGSLAEA